MLVDELDYFLPTELIASRPLSERDASRLLVLNRQQGDIVHRNIRQLAELLPPSLFVVNNTQVIPARLFAEKVSGGRVEFLFVEQVSISDEMEIWLALGKASKGLKIGEKVYLKNNREIMIEIIGKHENGELELCVHHDVHALLQTYGVMPLPPYMKRSADEEDKQRYQTVFADIPGAVAAPTAGLHFTDALIQSLKEKGHQIVPVTLHVGLGTFRPIEVNDLNEHSMHFERFEISENSANAISNAKKQGTPVIAVGTTVVRTLESASDEKGMIFPMKGKTQLLIQPGYRFKACDALFTNFHLPRSTLLALVMAFGGKENIRRAYQEAIREQYRFYSYGDAMLIYDRIPQ